MQEHGASSASCLWCEQTGQQFGKCSSKDHVGMRCWCCGWLTDLGSSGTCRLQNMNRDGEVFLKIPLQQVKPVSWSQIGKSASLWLYWFLTGIFQGKTAVLAAEMVSGNPCYALDLKCAADPREERVAAVPLLGKC